MPTETSKFLHFRNCTSTCLKSSRVPELSQVLSNSCSPKSELNYSELKLAHSLSRTATQGLHRTHVHACNKKWAQCGHAGRLAQPLMQRSIGTRTGKHFYFTQIFKCVLFLHVRRRGLRYRCLPPAQ